MRDDLNRFEIKLEMIFYLEDQSQVVGIRKELENYFDKLSQRNNVKREENPSAFIFLVAKCMKGEK